MAATRNPIQDELFYEQAARDYCRSLPLEHFMESTPQSTQRKITLESFDLIHAARPEVKCFNELLVQYPTAIARKLGRVVPDNMVVIHDGLVRAKGSFNTPFEEAKPFLVLEYVSQQNKRKDYVDNMRRYEKDLKVPYYLLFEPDKHQVLLFKLSPRGKYASVPPNEDDRLEIPELELEAALLRGWVRFWFRGKLLPLPADLARDLERTKRKLQAAERQAAEASRQADSERQARLAAEDELARLRAEVEALRRRKT